MKIKMKKEEKKRICLKEIKNENKSNKKERKVKEKIINKK